MVRAICGVQLKGRRRCDGIMMMLGLKDQVAMTSSVHWYGHVFRRREDPVMRMA